MSQVLILDGQQRSALAATRSLGRRGLVVHTAEVTATSLAGASRYARCRVVYPDPLLEPEHFVDTVLRQARSLGVAAVLPLTDVSTMLLTARESDFDPIRLLCAPQAAYELVSDKARLIDLARQHGVRVPHTVAIRAAHDLEERRAGLTFPLVLKPARSRLLTPAGIVSTEVRIVRSYDEALDYLRAQTWLDLMPCLVQEYVPGHGAGIFACYAGGRPVAWFCHRRLREKPPRGGVSVLSQSVPLESGLLAPAKAILDAAGWDGAAMVEFKVAADATPYLMEINARLWGSLQLAIDAGVDFPWLLYQRATAASMPPAVAYRTGIRLRWLLGDIDNLAIQLRERPGSRGSKLTAIARFIGSTFDLRSRQEIFRWSDPRPALHEIRTWLRALA